MLHIFMGDHEGRYSQELESVLYGSGSSDEDVKEVIVKASHTSGIPSLTTTEALSIHPKCRM